MEELLLRKLIEKNYVAPGTEVDAIHKGIDMSGNALHYFEGTYTISRMVESKSGKLLLELASIRDGYQVRVNAAAVRGIDGMTPLRFAENYMIAPDGTDIKLAGKRRGRRPKGWVDPELTNEG